MKNPRFVVGLVSPDGQFQGYLKSISIYHQKVTSANNKGEAKAYATTDAANKDGNLAAIMTHGGLLYQVVAI